MSHLSSKDPNATSASSATANPTSTDQKLNANAATTEEPTAEQLAKYTALNKVIRETAKESRRDVVVLKCDAVFDKYKHIATGVSKHDPKHMTPLMVTAETANRFAYEWLLTKIGFSMFVVGSHDVKFDKKDKDGRDALDHAIIHQDLEPYGGYQDVSNSRYIQDNLTIKYIIEPSKKQGAFSIEKKMNARFMLAASHGNFWYISYLFDQLNNKFSEADVKNCYPSNSYEDQREIAVKRCATLETLLDCIDNLPIAEKEKTKKKIASSTYFKSAFMRLAMIDHVDATTEKIFQYIKDEPTGAAADQKAVSANGVDTTNKPAENWQERYRANSLRFQATSTYRPPVPTVINQFNGRGAPQQPGQSNDRSISPARKH